MDSLVSVRPGGKQKPQQVWGSGSTSLWCSGGTQPPQTPRAGAAEVLAQTHARTLGSSAKQSGSEPRVLISDASESRATEAVPDVPKADAFPWVAQGGIGRRPKHLAPQCPNTHPAILTPRSSAGLPTGGSDPSPAVKVLASALPGTSVCGWAPGPAAPRGQAQLGRWGVDLAWRSPLPPETQLPSGPWLTPPFQPE